MVDPYGGSRSIIVVSGPLVVPVAHLEGCYAVVSGPLVVPVAT